MLRLCEAISHTDFFLTPKTPLYKIFKKNLCVDVKDWWGKKVNIPFYILKKEILLILTSKF